MAISQAMVTSFKVEILDGVHNFGVGVTRASTAADTFKLALYTSSATLDASTTAYTTSNEVSSSGTNYAAGGLTLTISQAPTSTGTTAFLDFDDITWASATITANGALIYNATQGNKAVAVLAFGSDKTSTAGNFTIQFPAAAASTAILRIA
jgi:predicted enzyme related to lactoylglutathione lyase